MRSGRLMPNDPGYADAVACLLAKAQALDPGFRLAEEWERRSLPPARLYSFTGSDGRMVAPVFIREEAPC